MTDATIRPQKRLGAVFLSAALVAAACVGTGELGASPAGSVATGSPGASPPPSAAESASPSALPEALAAKTWITLNPVGALGAAVAGTLDGRYHLTLPPDEVGLTAADFRVVSVIWTKAPDGSIERSTLIVRDLRENGAEVARFAVSGQVAPGQAALAGETLFFAGDGASDRVAGVYAGSLADGTVRTLIDPGPPPAELAASIGSVVFALQMGPGVSRGPVVLSPSGRTLGSNVCGNGRCTIEVVDLSGGTVQRPFTAVPFALWLLSETTVIAVDDTSVYAYDGSGGARWTLKDKRPQSAGYLTSDGSQLVVLYQDLNPGADAAVVLASVDVVSGGERVLRRWGRDQVAPLLWAAVSTDEAAVLIPGGMEPGEALDRGGGTFRADVLDLRTGALAQASLVISDR